MIRKSRLLVGIWVESLPLDKIIVANSPDNFALNVSPGNEAPMTGNHVGIHNIPVSQDDFMALDQPVVGVGASDWLSPCFLMLSYWALSSHLDFREDHSNHKN